MIIWGGSNDVNKNETNVGLKHLRHLVANRNKTSNVVVTACHRYDLHETSYINKEIQIFNRKMGKIMDNMTIIKTNLNRDDLKQHGLYLNTSDKERMRELIGKHISHLISKKKEVPSLLKWKENQNEHIHGAIKEPLKCGDKDKQQKKMVNRWTQ